MVVPDQLVDRTALRVRAFDGSGAVHARFSDPYFPALLAWDGGVNEGGTLVIVEGPRFSTRAESRSYAGAGWSLVNLTGYPEAVPARGLGVCCAALGLVTDLDAGVDAHGAVHHGAVLAPFSQHVGLTTDLLSGVIVDLDHQLDCSWSAGLRDVTVPLVLA
ncbi:hypothetical protein [Pengzhenrongella phosphoraccumulans]|uniref:phosphorylase family protein n=1 Tax=Pengzhenrongella phosphoraccumulans TaxID=3114394 RepID=UPI00388F1FFA